MMLSFYDDEMSLSFYLHGINNNNAGIQSFILKVIV